MKNWETSACFSHSAGDGRPHLWLPAGTHSHRQGFSGQGRLIHVDLTLVHLPTKFPQKRRRFSREEKIQSNNYVYVTSYQKLPPVPKAILVCLTRCPAYFSKDLRLGEKQANKINQNLYWHTKASDEKTINILPPPGDSRDC